ncbi:response regulator transcription factor [Bacillus sp. FJAT-27445]|uniref:response regulator transcription factor n=1 Tax=Bacillus sp. FJAT-27445 TaxID=1679166 RepID=UPI0007433AF4|nr:response regulator transcription factor [Bacillus sp. FJAT-27445]
MIHVLIVDDHPAVGEGTRTIINAESDMEADVLTESDKVMVKLQQGKYDIFLIDLYMPKVNGIELAKAILHVNPLAKVLIYSGFDLMAHFNLLIEAGVSGFISKTASGEQLITSIRCALNEDAVIPLQLLKQLRRVNAAPTTVEGQQNLGDISLTKKEQQILEAISKGMTNKAIAITLAMSQRTIEYNLTKIFNKLGVGSRTEALMKAKEFGLLSRHAVKSE